MVTLPQLTPITNKFNSFTPITQKFNFSSSTIKIYILILVLAVFSGTATGYILASTKSSPTPTSSVNKAQQDSKTFKDFAEGTIQKKTQSNSDYSEGTHLLIRANAVPVALTSSVVDLTMYEGKKVKVFGETQKALKQGWLMDVGKVEIQ